MTHIDTHGGPERFALETDDHTRIPFDAIEASGYGYWELKAEGETRGIVHDLGEWPAATVDAFRAIQHGRDVDLGAQE